MRITFGFIDQKCQLSPIEGNIYLLPVRAGKITNLPAIHLCTSSFFFEQFLKLTFRNLTIILSKYNTSGKNLFTGKNLFGRNITFQETVRNCIDYIEPEIGNERLLTCLILATIHGPSCCVIYVILKDIMSHDSVLGTFGHYMTQLPGSRLYANRIA